MAWYNRENAEILNFMVIGNRHSGYGLLQSSLAAHPDIVCHGDLLHDDDKVRKVEHSMYFGTTGKIIDHFDPTHLSVEQYFNNKIFDNILHGEKAVGVKVTYDHLRHYDLWDYTDQRCRRGDFCLVHVVRNPIACYVAWKQQQQREGNAEISSSDRLPAICIEPAELTQFVRDHTAAMSKVNKLCPDRAVIPYHELLLDFRGVLENLLEFLELKFSPACLPNQKRVQRRDVRSRVMNWTELKNVVPHDVLEYMNSTTLF